MRSANSLALVFCLVLEVFFGAIGCDQAPALERPETSLFGSELDGALRVDDYGLLVVDRELRRRFDHFLVLEGEYPLETIDAHVRDHFARELSADAATEAGYTWQDYLEYRKQARVAWSAAHDVESRFDAIRSLRRDLLGVRVAEAFFDAEEAEWSEALQRHTALNMASSRDERAQRGYLPLQSEPGGLLDQLRNVEALFTNPDERFQARAALVGADAAFRLAELDARRSAER